jgi:two-component system NarL family response regulator
MPLAPAPDSTDRPAGGRLRVVVADNDGDALDLVTIDLGLEGHDVVGTAPDGARAVQLCRSLQPDVLVVDLRMPPGPDGLAVARELRDQPGLRVVLYTNYRDASVARAAAEAGASYLLKGDLRALRRAVTEVPSEP